MDISAHHFVYKDVSLKKKKKKKKKKKSKNGVLECVQGRATKMARGLKHFSLL